ncbi:oligosaccharide flippase family protein [Vagococcus fluvialis]|uniref:oligosaccharide flippase family protein n=1 Tax=Vagococcus fluvialis TaxID=2738 RepID=UPI003B219BAF
MGKLSGFYKNVSYTFSSNLLSLIISTIVTLVVPKILGVEEYGYFQLYIFYTSYVGFLHFGLCDGIYLKYGGFEYSQLDKSLFKGQLIILGMMEIIITLPIVVIIISYFNDQYDNMLVLLFASFNIIVLNIRTFFMYVLQATNRMKEFSIITVLDRIFYIIIVIGLICLKSTTVPYLMIADLFGKSVSLIYAFYVCREIVKSNRITWSFEEALDNIKIGMNLMISTLCSILIMGVVRFGIQTNWSVEVYGKVALTLSISNMLMIFVNAVSLAIFPLLKRVDESKYEQIYPLIKNILIPIVFLGLLGYYPIYFLLSIWLPEYHDALRFMSIVFPMVVFESKVSLLSSTYLKALRKEKIMFKINVTTAVLSVILTVINVNLFNSLFLALISIVILTSFRSILSEYFLSKFIKIQIKKDCFLDVVLSAVFISGNWLLGQQKGFFIFSISLIFYFFYKKEDFREIFQFVKSEV